MRSNELIIDVAWQPLNSWRAVSLLKRVAEHTARSEGFSSGHLSIAAVGATAMATLHERYLGIAGPTDVLTFDLATDRRRGVLAGEVVVCTDVARQRSGRRQRSFRAAKAELALYVVHGILHLAGYEDGSSRGFTAMHKREDELLMELGLGPVFHSRI